ncbi:hypothetical protein B0A48_15502 [Cryoendolithus antarcticus]|uniref:Armadillo repeat-containing protein 8 n=1 Tax=Cryoendolithus antarcticus TaxID=1507870 RepID=A0A1V8SGG9_9PEZI|nr:hypothetical protein B0A48_15502 [Cryoendolithus antarcticus]
MVQAITPEAIQALGQSTAQEQIALLRELKNSIVGHDQGKEFAVRHGVLDVLLGIRSNVNEARVQATQILGSIAGAGAEYVEPLVAAGVAEYLLEGVSGRDANDGRLVTASLQALRSLAASWNLAATATSAAPLPLYNWTNSFVALAQSPGVTSRRLSVLCDIVAYTAVEGYPFDTAILDTLAGLLTAHAIASGQFDDRSPKSACPVAPPPAAVPSILGAIGSIIQVSTYRTWRFILSQPIEELFTKIALGDGDLRYMMSPKYGLLNGEGCLLPPLHIPPYKNVSYASSFPIATVDRGHDIGLTGSDLDHANAVVGWLLHFARSYDGEDRCIALKLVALVHDALRATTRSPQLEVLQRTHDRVRQLNYLAVPLAVRLVEDSNVRPEGDKLREEACAVLALLVRSERDLQAGAVEAKAIKHVCISLKRSFDPITLSKPTWSPRKASADANTDSASCRLGRRGLAKEVGHAMRWRKGALDAVAALTHQKDDLHRKAVVDAGVVGCVVEGLRPFEERVWEGGVGRKATLGSNDGNAVPVVLAACNAARSMSRSVGLLRTSLLDASLAKPIVTLMRHVNARIKLAATDVCINLLNEFSPTKRDLIAEGVVPLLCGHARSGDLELRRSSIWALKHLLNTSPRDLRIQVLDELTPEFLMSAMSGQSSDTASSTNGNGGVNIRLSSANAAGEQVDLLNPSSMDIDPNPSHDLDDDDDDEEDDDEDEDGEILLDEPSQAHYQTSQLRSTLTDHQTPKLASSAILQRYRQLEENEQLMALRLDTEIQEHALDLLRNFIYADAEDCVALTSHVYTAIGSSRLLDLLANKLSPLSASSALQRTPTLYASTPILHSTLRLTSHLCASSPSHKATLLAHTTTLHALLPHFTHPTPSIRLACLDIIVNLTWVEDERDRSPGARDRIRLLREAGLEEKVRALTGDSDAGVRERAKVAVRQVEGG